MATSSKWHRWGRHAAATGLGGLVTWFAFVAHTPVPLLDWFDLGVHEAGHLVAALLPETLMFMAGSFAQIAFPLAMMAYFGIHHRDWASAGFFAIWAGASTWDVSVYAGDAVRQQLPLVGGGQHDWAFILGRFDALHLTDQIARGIESAGLVMAICGFGLIFTDLLRRRPVVVGTPLVAVPLEPVDLDVWVAASRLPFKHEESNSA